MSFLAGFYGAKALQEQENNKAWRQIWQEDRRMDIEERKVDLSEQQLEHTIDMDEWDKMFRREVHDDTQAFNWADFELREADLNFRVDTNNSDRAQDLFQMQVDMEWGSRAQLMGAAGNWKELANQIYSNPDADHMLGDIYMGYAQTLEGRMRDTPFVSDQDALNVIIAATRPGGAWDENDRQIFLPDAYVHQAFEYLIEQYPDNPDYAEAYESYKNSKDERLEEAERIAEEEKYMRQLGIRGAENTVALGAAEVALAEDDVKVSAATVGARIQGAVIETMTRNAQLRGINLENSDKEIRLRYLEEALGQELAMNAELIREAVIKNDFSELAANMNLDLLADQLQLSNSDVRIALATEAFKIDLEGIGLETAQANLDSMLQALGFDAELHTAEMTKFMGGLALEGRPELVELLTDDQLEGTFPHLEPDETRDMLRELAQEVKDENLSKVEVDMRLKESQIDLNRATANASRMSSALKLAGPAAPEVDFNQVKADTQKRYGYNSSDAREALNSIHQVVLDSRTLQKAVEIFPKNPTEAANLIYGMRDAAHSNYFPSSWSNIQGQNEITLGVLEAALQTAQGYINSEVSSWAGRAAAGIIGYNEATGTNISVEDYMDLGTPGIIQSGAHPNAAPSAYLDYLLTQETKAQLGRETDGWTTDTERGVIAEVAANSFLNNVSAEELRNLSEDRVGPTADIGRAIIAREYQAQGHLSEEMAWNKTYDDFPTDESMIDFMTERVEEQDDTSSMARYEIQQILGHDVITDDMSGEAILRAVDKTIPPLVQTANGLQKLVNSGALYNAQGGLDNVYQVEGRMVAETSRDVVTVLYPQALSDMASLYEIIFGKKMSIPTAYEMSIGGGSYDGTAESLPSEIWELARYGVVDFVTVTNTRTGEESLLPTMSFFGIPQLLSKTSSDVDTLLAYQNEFQSRGYTLR